jgi:hypothetical protein
MAQYRVGYNRTEIGHLTFEADNLQHAKELFEKYTNAEIEELPNMAERIFDGDTLYLDVEEND